MGAAHNDDGTLKASSIAAAGGQSTSAKGQPNGYASLDGSGKVPTSQLPAMSSSIATATDVTLTSPSNGQVLTYNSGSSKWTNQAAPSAPVTSVNSKTGAVSLAAGDVGAYTTSAVDAFFRNTDAVVLYNTGTSSYPVRSSVTSDSLRPVRWRGPVAPTIGGSYAIDGLDVWEQTS